MQKSEDSPTASSADAKKEYKKPELVDHGELYDVSHGGISGD